MKIYLQCAFSMLALFTSTGCWAIKTMDCVMEPYYYYRLEHKQKDERTSYEYKRVYVADLANIPKNERDIIAGGGDNVTLVTDKYQISVSAKDVINSKNDIITDVTHVVH